MKTLIVGTHDGLFEASLDRRAPTARRLDFDGARFGWTRSPVLIDARDPELRYLATTTSGVFRSTDGGRTWHEHNVGLTYKEVWVLEQHPSTGDLFVGTGPTAIARSSDRAESWQMFDGLTTAPFKADWCCHVPPYHSRVRGIALSGDDVGLIVAAIEEGWVVRSTDGGRTWDNPRVGVGQDGHSISFVPASPEVVLGATGTGMYRSTDKAATFALVDLDLPYATKIATHPRLSHTVYATAGKYLPRFWQKEEGAGMEVIRSDDDGATWRRLGKGWPEYVKAGSHGATCFDPDDPDFFAVGMSDGSIWVTEDGNEFREVISGLPYVTSLAVAPT